MFHDQAICRRFGVVQMHDRPQLAAEPLGFDFDQQLLAGLALNVVSAIWLPPTLPCRATGSGCGQPRQATAAAGDRRR